MPEHNMRVLVSGWQFAPGSFNGMEGKYGLNQNPEKDRFFILQLRNKSQGHRVTKLKSSMPINSPVHQFTISPVHQFNYGNTN